MILLDLNQVMISNLMMQLNNRNNIVEEDMLRHMILNSLRLYKTKFSKDYGDLVMTRITGVKKSSHTTKHTEKQTVKSLLLTGTTSSPF